jgi:hypothetical protein
MKKIQIEFEFEELLKLSESLRRRRFQLYEWLSDNDVVVEDLSKNIDKTIEKFEKIKLQKVIKKFKINYILEHLYEFKQLIESLNKIEEPIRKRNK